MFFIYVTLEIFWTPQPYFRQMSYDFEIERTSKINRKYKKWFTIWMKCIFEIIIFFQFKSKKGARYLYWFLLLVLFMFTLDLLMKRIKWIELITTVIQLNVGWTMYLQCLLRLYYTHINHKLNRYRNCQDRQQKNTKVEIWS